MHVSFTPEELEFRAQVRQFFATRFPADIRAKVDGDVALDREDYVRWQKILYEQGWAAVNWPGEPLRAPGPCPGARRAADWGSARALRQMRYRPRTIAAV